MFCPAVRHSLCALAVALPLSLLQADPGGAASSGPTTYDNNADFSYAGSASIGEGSRPIGKITSFQARASTVEAVPLGGHDARSTLLAGFGGQWFEFNPPGGSIVPARLGALWLNLGLAHQFDSSWSARAEVNPGVYNDLTHGGRGFDAPVALSLVYASSRDLQWVFFANLDLRSGTPVVGGVGARWKFAPDWTLSLLLPAPRLEWAVAPHVTLFAGADLARGTFRVADDFGRRNGRPELDGQVVDYREITAGAGARWQVSRNTALHLSVGRMLDRRFEFHDRNLLLNGDGAPAVQFVVTSAF